MQQVTLGGPAGRSEAWRDRRCLLERAVHDGAQQQLLGLQLLLLGIDPADRERWGVVRDEVRSRISETRTEIEHLAAGWSPRRFDATDLDRSLAGLAADNSVPVDVMGAFGGAHGLDDEQTRLVFDMVAESLANAVRHGGARRIRVNIAHTATAGGDRGRSIVEVVDDGAGFSPAATTDRSAPDGGGLASLASRAATVGAELTARPGTDGGTQVELCLVPRAPCVPRSGECEAVGDGAWRPRSLEERRMWVLDRMLTDRLAGAACGALGRAEALLSDALHPGPDRWPLAEVAAEVEFASVELRSVVRRLRAWPAEAAGADAPLEIMLRDAARRARVRIDLLVEAGDVGGRRDALVAIAEELMFATAPGSPAAISVRFRRGGVRLRARLVAGLSAVQAAIIEDLTASVGATTTVRNAGPTGVEVQVELA